MHTGGPGHADFALPSRYEAWELAQLTAAFNLGACQDFRQDLCLLQSKAPLLLPGLS